jgi:hypothetical protein
MVTISKIEVDKTKPWLQNSSRLGRISKLFQKNGIGQNQKKAPTENVFYDGAAIANLKSRLKMKPTKHQVLMVSTKN